MQTLFDEMVTRTDLEAERVNFAAGQTLASSTSEPRFGILLRGRARCTQELDGQRVVLHDLLGRGDFYNEPALCHGVPDLIGSDDVFGMRVVAVTSGNALEFPVASIQRLTQERPDLLWSLLERLSIKLRFQRTRSAQLIFDDIHRRLLRALVRFGQGPAASVDPESSGQIVLQMTHRDLAQAIGSARETVSLALTQLRQQGVLNTGRGQVTFKVETLHEMLQGLDAETNNRSPGDGSGAGASFGGAAQATNESA